MVILFIPNYFQSAKTLLVNFQKLYRPIQSICLALGIYLKIYVCMFLFSCSLAYYFLFLKLEVMTYRVIIELKYIFFKKFELSYNSINIFVNIRMSSTYLLITDRFGVFLDMRL